MVSTVLVDLGNVLVHVDTERTVARLAELSGQTKEVVRQAAYGPGYVAVNRGDIAWREFGEGLAAQLGIGAPLEAVADSWRASLYPYREVIDIIAALAPRHRLVLLSNTDEVHFEYSRRIVPLLEQFAGYAISCKVKSMKPEPRIYQEAVHMARCSPDRCLFIDDLEANVHGAAVLGIPAVRLTSPEQLRGELLARGLLPGV
jgi:putative hydrolase of the HAD superfamily